MIMDDDFGPLVTAEQSYNDFNEEIDNLQKRILELQSEKSSLNDEFGQKRAKFMDLFCQKEEESNTSKGKIHEQQKLIDDLQKELNDMKTSTVINEITKDEELTELKRRYQEEIASMQHIMKEAVHQAHQEASSQLESERYHWAKINERIDAERVNIGPKNEKEWSLGSVAKTLQKKVSSTLSSSEFESLEDSMKKAQENAEILKSVVVPLEEEIDLLKKKLRDTADRNDHLEKQLTKKSLNADGDAVSNESFEYDEKVKELNLHLDSEKSSRTDLEMYVAVLNTQKEALYGDADKLRSQFQEVCKLLQLEKRDHNDLKQTWQMANDQFLESQRLMMIDIRRMEDILSCDQIKQLSEFKKKDAEEEKHRFEMKLLEKTESKHKEDEVSSISDNTSSLSQNRSDHGDKTNRALSSALVKSPSCEDLSFSESLNLSIQSPTSNSSYLDISSTEVNNALQLSPEKYINIPQLPSEMHKCITDPTPEREASQSLLASAKAKVESMSVVGRRIVSDKEWSSLQEDLKAAREKLTKPCDSCNNLETQVQSAQSQVKELQSQLKNAERHLQGERQAATNNQIYKEELEEKIVVEAENSRKAISPLLTKIEESEKYLSGLKQQFSQIQNDLQQDLKKLNDERVAVQKELVRIQGENDSLIGKHSLHSQQMQEETINFPDSVEELHVLLLKYREEVITAKVAKEHAIDTAKSQALFLKDQIHAEQQERSKSEETYTRELLEYQEQLATLHSVKSEMERQTTLRKEVDNKLTEINAVVEDHKEKIQELESHNSKMKNENSKKEEENFSLKSKIKVLQDDLENSEVVSRDFVKLSQSLQMQLEKIRSADNEVRWQHEEDIDDCCSCRQTFSVTKRKHHCRHCGKIFCADCLSKTVNSGPNLRPSKVCDVCHTILVQDATPYFSSDPPATPD